MEHGTQNGSPTLYLVLGEIRSGIIMLNDTVKSTHQESREDMRALTRRLDMIQESSRRPLKSLKQKAGDIAPYLTGLVVLGLATGGEWDKLGKFLHAFGK